jgi:hypothetical protein
MNLLTYLVCLTLSLATTITAGVILFQFAGAVQ